MVECKNPEVVLFTPAKQLLSPALYVEFYFRVIVRARSKARYGRLKGTEAKAAFIAKALAMPDSAPGYAEQQLRGCFGESSKIAR